MKGWLTLAEQLRIAHNAPKLVAFEQELIAMVTAKETECRLREAALGEDSRPALSLRQRMGATPMAELDDMTAPSGQLSKKPADALKNMLRRGGRSST